MTEAEYPDQDELAACMTILRPTLEAFLAHNFGEKCPDFCEGCECCERWQAMERLLRPI